MMSEDRKDGLLCVRVLSLLEGVITLTPGVHMAGVSQASNPVLCVGPTSEAAQKGRSCSKLGGMDNVARACSVLEKLPNAFVQGLATLSVEFAACQALDTPATVADPCPFVLVPFEAMRGCSPKRTWFGHGRSRPSWLTPMVLGFGHAYKDLAG